MTDNNYQPPKFISPVMDQELFNRMYHRQEKNEIVSDMIKRFHLSSLQAAELTRHADIIEEKVTQFRLEGK